MSSKFYDIGRLQQFAKNVFILQRDEFKEQIFTYKQIVANVKKLLKQYGQLKLKRDSCIALKLSDHSAGSCTLLLSILNNNCYFYPLDISAKNEDELLASGVPYLITDERHYDGQHKNFKLLQRLEIFDEVFYLSEVLIEDASNKPIEPNDICYILRTSGSTGTPKLVYVPYECITINVVTLSAHLLITQQDVIFLCAPLTFDPFIIEFFLVLQSGASLLITNAALRLAPEKLLQILFPIQAAQRGITVLQMTPALFRTFGKAAIRKVILKPESCLRILLLGGEAFPSKQELLGWLGKVPADEAQIFKPKRIFNIYGITEVSCWSTIYECNIESKEMLPERMPIGTAIDETTELRIINAEGAILSGAAQGELLIGSNKRKCFIPMLDEALTWDSNAVVFRNSGDWVERLADGTIYYLGRLNNTIKRYGKRICLDELDQKIAALLNTNQQQALCLWQSRTNKLICCLTCKNADSLSSQLTSQLIMNNLLACEKPDKFIYLNELPINSHGKFSRKLLEQKLKISNYAKGPAEILKSFLSDVLALKLNLMPQDASTNKRLKSIQNLSFLAAGGTSFHALSLASEIGAVLKSSEDERELLTMFLSETVQLEEILRYLQNAQTISAIQQNLTKLPRYECNMKRRRLKLHWRSNLLKCVDSSPVFITNKYICVGSHAHIMLTLDAFSGREVSRIALNDRIECTVTFAGRTLGLVGCYDGNLYAFDFIKGNICWRFNADGMIKAKPLLLHKDSSIMVACYAANYNLICITLETQSVLWRCRIGDKGIFATPISFACDNYALICTLSGIYASINTINGNIKWTQQCETPIFATPVFVNNECEFIIAEVSGKLHICKTANGVKLHTFTATGNIFSSITTSLDTDNSNTAIKILFGCHDQHVYCLKYIENCLILLWKSNLNAAIYATPILIQHNDEKFLFVCTTKGLLVLLELNTGLLIAKHNIQAEIFSTPCAVESADKIYFGCRDNFLYCFGIE